MKTFRQRYKKRRRTKKKVYIGGVIEDICSICHEKIVQEDKVYMHSECNNKFHMDCIKTWCNGKEVCPCPMCRRTLKLEELFSFEERLSSYKEACDKEKMELELEIEDLEHNMSAIDEEWRRRYASAKAQYSTLADEFNETQEKLIEMEKKYNDCVSAYNEMADKCDYNALLYDQLISRYNDLLDRFNRRVVDRGT
jgi:hypothetical protein